MTDATINIAGSPILSEIFAGIASYLTVPELAQFKQVCRLFNHIGSHVYFLQPFYNRLYALDKTLPAGLTSEGALVEFKKAFEKIKERQNNEINFLNEQYTNAYRADIDSLLAMPSNTIEALEERSLLLDKINIEIINEAIADQPRTFLTLSGITRFIVTNENAVYMSHLTGLDCTHNALATLNLSHCPKLQQVHCGNNELISLNISSCTKLQKLYCSSNLLTYIEGLKSSCATLQHLDCFRNPLASLDLTNFTALKWVSCGNAQIITDLEGSTRLQPLAGNQLIDLKVQGCVALQMLNIISQLTNIDLRGASQAIIDSHSELETQLLFEQLSCATTLDKKEAILDRLGSRYSTFNSLRYGYPYEARKLASETLTNGVLLAWNYASSFIPESFKRKREDEDQNPSNKKPRPNGS